MARQRKDMRLSRTSMSCERCRGRKTKCKNPVPGPCDYCRSINEECHIDPDKRRQRPYYFVSEEEFRNMQVILKHYVPDTDLTPDNLRSLALRCQTAKRTYGDLADETNTLSPPMTAIPNNEARTEQSNLGFESIPVTDSSDEEAEDNLLQQVLSLYHKLGCLLEDSQGQYRYMGAESGLPFNAAIRCFKRNGLRTPLSPDLIPAMVTVTMPLPISHPAFQPIALPPWETCLRLTTKYFEDVHCLYWLYSSERFHAQLEESYQASQEMLTASWRCALYSILAIAKLGLTDTDNSDENVTAKDYLEQAKSFVPEACDEASLESIRAMMLLATAMQSHGFSNPASLYSSLAVQMAYSLGIHYDKYSSTYGSVEREHSRRIWWSLTILDQDLSLRLGKPSSAEYTWSSPPLPSETILPSGPYSPPGYLAVCSTLSQLGKTIRTHVYRDPLLPNHRPSMAVVRGILNSLQGWMDSIPSHLNISVPNAPLHRRAIAVLHLRYHSMRLLIGRPFLLYQLLCWKGQREAECHPSVSQFTDICTASAEKMLEIMHMMVTDDLHSNIIALDFYYALDILQIFICVFALTKAEQQFDNIRKCLKVLRLLSTTGFGETMISEVLFELTEWRLFPDCADPLDCLQGFDDSLLRVDAVNDFHDRIFGDCNVDFDQAWNTIFPQPDWITSWGP